MTDEELERAYQEAREDTFEGRAEQLGGAIYVIYEALGILRLFAYLDELLIRINRRLRAR